MRSPSKGGETMADATMSGAMPDRGAAAVAALVPWWLVLIQGIVALLVGIMLFTSPATTTLVLVQVLGWYWLFSGIFQLGSLFVDRTKWGWRVLSGVLGIILGGYTIGAPLMGAAAVGAYSIGVNFAETLWYVPTSIGTVLFPHVANSSLEVANVATARASRR